jgi:replicative DNA helicase
MLEDKNSVQQVLGGLMEDPQLLSRVDEYNLTITDFHSRFERYIFAAISGLYEDGAQNIQPIDVENYLSTNDSARVNFEQNNGIEYLQDICELSDSSNFPYYYKKLKKINLLRDLSKSGFDTSNFYCDDLTMPHASEINSKFEELSIQDITDAIKKKVLGLETKYSITGDTEVMSMADDIDDFIEGLVEEVDVGLPVQGEIYNKIINGASPSALTIRSGSSGLGKALPNSTIIPTPDGYKRVDEIKVGDYLFDAFGKPTRVLGVYPQGRKEVNFVRFKDGRVALCCDEHLWSYCTSGQKKNSKKDRKFYTKTLKELKDVPLKNTDGGYNILVPMNYAVEYPAKEHFVPPYVFGLALGDGSFRQHESSKSFQYSSEDDFLPNYIGEQMGWIVKKGSEKNFTWYFAKKEKQDNQFDKINVWVEDLLVEHPELINCKSEDKFIPNSYLFDSVENRFDLLSGLLDSDGTVDERGRISYITNSTKLRDNVVELARSLGFKTNIIVDSHKDTSICYVVTIAGRPEDKAKLFKLPRKKKRILDWFNSSKRKENNDFNAIVEIGSCKYTEEMTCFYVDNEEHLFLMNDYIVTHNTRQAVGDACYLAYPIRYDPRTCKWVQEGSDERVLFIMTEQSFKEVRRMVLAYISGINDSRFKYATFTEDEKKRIEVAKKIIKKYEDNLILVRCPNPTIELIKTLVRENVITHDIKHVFYDYIFIGPSLLSEFKGFTLRNDEVLSMFATALKDLAVELGVSVFTSTQVNAKADDNTKIRSEGSLAGGRATINKADNGCICARPTPEELDTLKEITSQYGIPNMVTDMFKVRNGQWTQVRIWSIVDLGILRKQDLFITDARLNPIEGFYDEPSYHIVSFDDKEKMELEKTVREYNGE